MACKFRSIGDGGDRGDGEVESKDRTGNWSLIIDFWLRVPSPQSQITSPHSTFKSLEYFLNKNKEKKL